MEMYIFLTHSPSGNFAETRDGLDREVPTGTEWVQAIPSFTKIHHEQLMSGAIFLTFEKLGVKKYEK